MADNSESEQEVQHPGPLNDVGLCEVATHVSVGPGGTASDIQSCTNDAVGEYRYTVEGQTLETKLCEMHADYFDAEEVA